MVIASVILLLNFRILLSRVLEMYRWTRACCTTANEQEYKINANANIMSPNLPWQAETCNKLVFLPRLTFCI